MEMIQTTIAYFLKGGLVMWPLLACSVFVVSIAVERFLYYKEQDSGHAFAEEYCMILRDRGGSAALAFARAGKGRCAELLVMAGAMDCPRVGKEIFLEGQATLFIAELKSKLDYLGIIVTLSPLLGLLGTIVGMIGAFSIFNLQAGAPMAITGGIGEALIATATGLCVAILSLCVHTYFNHRLDNILNDLEQCANTLLLAETRFDRHETA
jgi:biopolymer transport protein ExbB